ncbi:hypothetical protein HID58_071587 [Brassica napus]|uniref:Uncharacterized protein n=1 Tax=Brassica napus TaxID=3708 RepID=A0ABQ7Z258_BRANA|nr:hypothetical protein HID58_071587 [Brassica napus]
MLLSYGGGEMNRHPTNGLRVLGPNLLICLQIQRPPPLIFPAPRCRILSLRSPWSSLSALSVISISEFSVVALYLSSPSSYSFVVKRFVKHLRSIKLFFNMDPLPENLVPRRIPNQCRPVVVVDGFEMDEQEKISRKILMAKTDHVHCGVPELPAHVLQSNPWQMEELSSNRIEHETVRDWLFTSDNARPGNIWQYYDDRKVAGNQLRRIQVVCHNDIDLLNPPAELDKRKHELKHLVQSPNSFSTVLQNDIDLLNPLAELETRKHKLKRLVQSPNYFFMDVKCQGCFNGTTVCSHSHTAVDVKCQGCFNIHSQTVVVCGNCQTVLCQQIPGYKKKSKSVEMSKLLAVEELESTKTLIEDLKLNLDKAETEEKQAKRDSELAKRESELAKLGVEETQQGIFGEASVATKAQLEAAQARHTSAEAEAVLASKEVERKVEEMPKLLQHSRADCFGVWKLPDSVVPVYSRKGEAHGRMLFQEKSDRLILKLEAIIKNSLIESPDDNGVF